VEFWHGVDAIEQSESGVVFSVELVGTAVAPDPAAAIVDAALCATTRVELVLMTSTQTYTCKGDSEYLDGLCCESGNHTTFCAGMATLMRCGSWSQAQQFGMSMAIRYK
jgi:hypothetical protein